MGLQDLIRALAICLALATPAGAQANCADRGKVIARLQSKYGETFKGGGLQNAQSVFEVWASDETGTWTILKSGTDGVSCVMASGTNWVPGAVLSLGVPG